MTDKMRTRPPIPKQLDELISAAEKPKVDRHSLPWLRMNVREDVIKSMNLYLSEPYMVKLQYLIENVPNMSKSKFARQAVERGIDEALESLLK